MPPYALIHVLEPARAAQYAALVERHHLSATPARSLEEALFHTQRLGQPALILSEVRHALEEFDFLRGLRKAKQTAPALLISGNWKLRNEAHRLRKQLGVTDVLAPSQSVATVEKALARALQGEPRVRAPKRALPLGLPLPVEGAARFEGREVDQVDGLAPEPAPGPASFPPMPLSRALKTPLYTPRLRQRTAERLPPAATLEEVLARTCRSLRAEMALVWLDDAYGGGLHGHFGWEAGLVPMVGTPLEWAPFRRMASTAPVLIQDARADKVLSRSPLVGTGLVGSFAGAPLPDASGERAGVLWIVQGRPHGLVPDVLEPLTVWAQHLGADLARLPVPLKLEVPDAPEAPAGRAHKPVVNPVVNPVALPVALEQQAAFEAAALALDHGLFVTDGSGRICASNRAALRLLGLKNRRLTGLSRARLIDRLRTEGKLEVSQAARLLRASAALDVELTSGPPPARILRWELRPLSIGRDRCLVDRIFDVTEAREQALERDRLLRVDPLTWLGNRPAFQESLAAELARALRDRSALSLALFTIDGYEQLEEALRDRVMRSVAWVISDLKRGYDPAARLDPGTLAVILPGAPAEAALRFAARVAEESHDLSIEGLPKLTLSAGVAQFDRGEDVDVLVARARAAVLEAAACGGDGVI